MSFDINNPFHRDAAIIAVKQILQTEFAVGIIPLPKRNDEPIPDGYVFTLDDFVLPDGATLPPIDEIWNVAQAFVSKAE